jgi:Spy/CpxP family protein refolding chaperone
LGERVGKAMHAQMEAVSSETFDENAIRAAASEVATAQAEMAVFHGRVHAEVYQVLTPEQQAKARELKTKMEARMQERAKRMQERRQERRPQRAPAE